MRAIETFPNLVTMFFARTAEQGDKPFLWRKSAGTWHPLSWNEVARQVAALSTALQALGLKPGDPVMLVSENRPEFCIADLAIMEAGCITVPTYTTNTTRDHQHILTDSGARAVDPGAVLSAWRATGLGGSVDAPRDSVVRLAARLGADRVVVGSVVGNRDHAVVTATVVAVPAGTVTGEATVEGPADSVTSGERR